MMADRRALYSWKEIAEALGVTPRTAQRWAKYEAMPVYRQGSGRKARVCAYSDELQSWREPGASRAVAERGTGAGASGLVPVVSSGLRLSRGELWAGAAAIALLAVAGLMTARVLRTPGPPAEAAFENSTLTVSDKRGRICWQKRFSDSVPGRAWATEPAAVLDVDGDGSPEVLFSYEPRKGGAEPGALFCFDRAGRLRWRHQYGGFKTFGGRVFDSNYVGRVFRPVEAGGRRYLITIASHYLWHPSVAALLDPATGRVLEQYWHPGAIHHLVLRDLDGDRDPEALLGAINNPGEGLGHPALAVLKVPFSRAARQAAPPDPRFPPLTGGGELAYVLFPCPDVNRALGVLPFVAKLGVDGQHRVFVQIRLPEEAAMVYYLDSNLNVVECRASDNLSALHERLRVLGLLRHPLTAREREVLCRTARLPAAPDGNDPGLEAFWAF